MSERIVDFRPAFDKRDSNPTKNYGIHSVDIRFVLKGEKGAVQFLLFSGWYLPETAAEHEARGIPPSGPYGADLGYHSPKPLHEGQEPIGQSCPYLDNKPCYYDGSVLAAERVLDVLLREGSEGVWRELEEYYLRTFGEAP